MKLIGFSVKLLYNDKVELNWQSAGEENFDKYEIQWCNNGKDWQNIGELAGTNINATTDYTYLHTQLSPVNYYRLKMIDRDGQFTYSKVLTVALATSMTTSIYPNPSRNYVTVTLPGAKPAVLELINSTGDIVLQKTISSLTSTVNISNVPAGIYTVRIIQDEKVSVNKLRKE